MIRAIGFDTPEDEEEAAARAAIRRLARAQAAIDLLDEIQERRETYHPSRHDSRFDGPMNYEPRGEC